jgi:small subunit ribosomal protein S13
VRIAGVDLPRNERMEVSLTRIFGIGRTASRGILQKTGVDPNKKTRDLTDEEGVKLRTAIENDYRVEGDLRREIAMNIKRLQDIGSYKGLRHRARLPVHGQRTSTNARTRKGPRKAIGGMKKKG